MIPGGKKIKFNYAAGIIIFNALGDAANLLI